MNARFKYKAQHRVSRDWLWDGDATTRFWSRADGGGVHAQPGGGGAHRQAIPASRAAAEAVGDGKGPLSSTKPPLQIGAMQSGMLPAVPEGPVSSPARGSSAPGESPSNNPSYRTGGLKAVRRMVGGGRPVNDPGLGA